MYNSTTKNTSCAPSNNRPKLKPNSGVGPSKPGKLEKIIVTKKNG